MHERGALIVAGLGFGDEGKGSIVDFLARQVPVAAVVRYNGGAQAAHTVHTADGKRHTFNQFGSGSFVPGVKTHLSRFMLVDPYALIEENVRLTKQGVRGAYDALTVDRDAKVVTSFHKMANILRELSRGTDHHGTCGAGIGETMLVDLHHPDLTIHVRDLENNRLLITKMKALQAYLQRELHELRGSWKVNADQRQGIKQFGAEATIYAPDIAEIEADYLWRYSRSFTTVSGEHLGVLAKEGVLVFEGAQGVLLDEWYGFHPHTTWSTTTFENARTLLRDIGYRENIETLGVLRAYATRHGAGPFPTEDIDLLPYIRETDNGDDGWQGIFRIGWFDMILAKYALEVCGGVDSLAITNLDKLVNLKQWMACSAYAYDPKTLSDDLRAVAEITPRGADLEITALRVKKNREDLVHQERLTSLLRHVSPLYDCEVPIHALSQGGRRTMTNSERILTMIEAELGTTVSIMSHGATASGKEFFDP